MLCRSESWSLVVEVTVGRLRKEPEQKCQGLGLTLGQMEERQQQGLKEGSGYKEKWRAAQDEGA